MRPLEWDVPAPLDETRMGHGDREGKTDPRRGREAVRVGGLSVTAWPRVAGSLDDQGQFCGPPADYFPDLPCLVADACDLAASSDRALG